MTIKLKNQQVFLIPISLVARTLFVCFPSGAAPIYLQKETDHVRGVLSWHSMVSTALLGHDGEL
jgi:hypothetical protein